MLNENQRRIFDQVSDHLNHQRRHKIAACKCKDLKPLHMFVSEVGGTGKSFFVECIRSLFKDMWKMMLVMTLLVQLQLPQDLVLTLWEE